MNNNFRDVNLIPKINALATLLEVQPIPNYLEIQSANDEPNDFNKFKEFKSIPVITLIEIFHTDMSALKNYEDYFDSKTLKAAALELGFFPKFKNNVDPKDDMMLFSACDDRILRL